MTKSEWSDQIQDMELIQRLSDISPLLREACEELIDAIENPSNFTFYELARRTNNLLGYHAHINKMLHAAIAGEALLGEPAFTIYSDTKD